MALPPTPPPQNEGSAQVGHCVVSSQEHSWSSDVGWTHPTFLQDPLHPWGTLATSIAIMGREDRQVSQDQRICLEAGVGSAGLRAVGGWGHAWGVLGPC